MPAACEAVQRVVDAGTVTRNQPPSELRRRASDAGDVIVGQVDVRTVRDILHRGRGNERRRGRVVQAMRAAQGLFDHERRPSRRDLVGGRGAGVGEVGRDRANVLDTEFSERMSERHYVHIVYFGVRGGE